MSVALTEKDTAAQPLPEKIAGLIQEMRWLAVAVLGIYLGLALWGFDKADPGWSHSAEVDRIANPGGQVGAWIADLLFYLCGLSAWWWVALLFYLVGWGYRCVDGLFGGGDRRPLYVSLSGFLLGSRLTDADART